MPTIGLFLSPVNGSQEDEDEVVVDLTSEEQYDHLVDTLYCFGGQ